ncbi:hypothetical protein EV182_000898 [Spiromyces aspiralis]|uniref:Uncharacterized protein n=1 Tax=Spiromyces aspiralis TaxID=68401 RepID=A0ACC1HUP4_9FUNG|nr:hypothetical protein EV182_000898 [Spiromyces aspiralis]
MLNPRHIANDAGSRLVELPDGDDEMIGLTSGDATKDAAAQLSAPSAPKRYALLTHWEQHKETIRHLYLDEKRPLKEVMEIMERDHRHWGSVKQYKTKLREWRFDIKYKRHQPSRPQRQSGLADRSLASTASPYHPQAHGAQSVNINHLDSLFPAADTGSADAPLFEAPEVDGAIDQIFQGIDAGYPIDSDIQPADANRTIQDLFQSPNAQDADQQQQHSQFADHGYAVEYFFQAPNTLDADDENAADGHSKATDMGDMPNADNIR